MGEFKDKLNVLKTKLATVNYLSKRGLVSDNKRVVSVEGLNQVFNPTEILKSKLTFLMKDTILGDLYFYEKKEGSFLFAPSVNRSASIGEVKSDKIKELLKNNKTITNVRNQLLDVQSIIKKEDKVFILDKPTTAFIRKIAIIFNRKKHSGKITIVNGILYVSAYIDRQRILIEARNLKIDKYINFSVSIALLKGIPNEAILTVTTNSIKAGNKEYEFDETPLYDFQSPSFKVDILLDSKAQKAVAKSAKVINKSVKKEELKSLFITTHNDKTVAVASDTKILSISNLSDKKIEGDLLIHNSILELGSSLEGIEWKDALTSTLLFENMNVFISGNVGFYPNFERLIPKYYNHTIENQNIKEWLKLIGTDYFCMFLVGNKIHFFTFYTKPENIATFEDFTYEGSIESNVRFDTVVTFFDAILFKKVLNVIQKDVFDIGINPDMGLVTTPIGVSEKNSENIIMPLSLFDRKLNITNKKGEKYNIRDGYEDLMQKIKG